MRLAFTLAVSAFALACGCSKHAAVQSPEAEAASPAPAPAPAADQEPEAETEPVVATPLQSLEIQKHVIRLKRGIRILFATDSDQLAAESSPILDEVASVLAQNEKLRIRVEGHTDNAGDAAHNQDLSTRRAAAVRAYLVTKGIPEDRLESIGCGQDVPVADNATDDGKQQNRRVEFVIVRKRRPAPNCQVYRPRDQGEPHNEHPAGATP